MTAVLAIAGWLAAIALAVRFARQAHRLELVADAAHELRGAAAGMAMAADALRRERSPLRRAALLEPAIDRMGAGLADLDAARGSAADLRFGALSLHRAVHAAVAAAAPQAARDGRMLRVRWHAGPLALRGDRRRIASILGNLIDNALEHGGPTVEVRGERASDGAVCVEVADSGSPSTSPAREDASGRRGRGLAIAARAARESGGRVSLRETADGTVASLELPHPQR